MPVAWRPTDVLLSSVVEQRCMALLGILLSWLSSTALCISPKFYPLVVQGLLHLGWEMAWIYKTLSQKDSRWWSEPFTFFRWSYASRVLADIPLIRRYYKEVRQWLLTKRTHVAWTSGPWVVSSLGYPACRSLRQLNQWLFFPPPPIFVLRSGARQNFFGKGVHTHSVYPTLDWGWERNFRILRGRGGMKNF